jgi:hypothetical protein
MRLAMALGALLRVLEQLAQRLQGVVHELAARLEHAFREMVRVARDLGFQLSLLLLSLGRIGLYLLPGVVAFAAGILLGWPWLWALGLLYCVGLVAAAFFIPTAGATTAADLAVRWAVFFPPTWYERAALREALVPVLRAWCEADDAVALLRRQVGARHPLRAPVLRVRDQMHRRMHRLRAEGKRALARGRAGLLAPPSAETTRVELERITASVTTLERLVRKAPAAHGATDPEAADDGLGDAVAMLEDLNRALESLDRR